MSAHEGVRQNIAADVQARWPTSLLLAEWEGHEQQTASESGRWSIQWGATEQLTVYPPVTRGIATLTLQVFIPDMRGTAKFTACADKVGELYDRKCFTFSWLSKPLHVRFETAMIQPIGVIAGRRQANIVIPLQWDYHL